jgi:ribosomal protein S6--L-glutamate ligase
MGKISPALNYSSFLNEAEDRGSIDIIILSGQSSPSKTAESFISECSNRGIECKAVNVNNCVLEKVYNGHLLREEKGDETIEILIRPETTAIVPRRGVITSSHTKRIMSDLEDSRYFCLNSLESIEICESKYTTSQVLDDSGIPVPRYSLVSGEDTLDRSLEEVGGEFPVVMKLLAGTQGIGVSVVDSYASLKSVYQTIRKLDPDGEILLQEKIDSNFDIRVQVITKKFDPLNPGKDNFEILGAMKREAVEKDFRTNYSLGGSVSSYEITEEIEKIACESANAVACHWCGVDIMIDSKTGNPYVLEVNSSPGTEGISEAIGKPIVGDVIDFISNKNNWSYTKMEVGYLETVEIPQIGKFVAKFDTGNGSTASSIHADELNIDGDQLKWKIGDVELENKIVGYTNTEIGRETVERPIIEVDLIFNGVKIPGVKIAPTDRVSKSTPLLINRKLMKRLGVMVNPHKAFVISDPIDDYSPLKTKGERHGGIEFDQSN